MIQVKPGDVFVRPDMIEGWTDIRILTVHSEVVRVEFLKPKSWWAKGVTGIMKRKHLKYYEKQSTAVEVDFAIDRLYLNSVNGILARGQRKDD